MKFIVIIFTVIALVGGAQAACLQGDHDGNGVVNLHDAIALALYVYEAGEIATCPDRYDLYPDSIVHFDTLVNGKHVRLVEKITKDTTWVRYQWYKVAFYNQNKMIDLYNHEWFSYVNGQLVDYWTGPNTFIQLGWIGHAWEDTLNVLSIFDIETLLGVTDTTKAMLYWTAPPSPAVAYDIRYSQVPITDINWGLAIPAPNMPKPFKPSCRESFLLTGLSPDTDYWVAIRSLDSTGIWSDLSNVVKVHTASRPLVESISPINNLRGQQ